MNKNNIGYLHPVPRAFGTALCVIRSASGRGQDVSVRRYFYLGGDAWSLKGFISRKYPLLYKILWHGIFRLFYQIKIILLGWGAYNFFYKYKYKKSFLIPANSLFSNYVNLYLQDFKFSKLTDEEKQKLNVTTIWGGAYGYDWHKQKVNYYKNEFDFVKFISQEYFESIEKLIVSDNIKNILEFGCGNGLKLQYFAKKYPQINFIGIDISTEVIKLANDLNECSNLNFEQNQIISFLNNNKNKNIDIITCSGTLEYFVFDELISLFKTIKDYYKRLNKIGYFILFEPVTCYNFETEINTKSRGGKGSICYSHNYFHWLKNNGFKIIESSVKDSHDLFKKYGRKQLPGKGVYNVMISALIK